MRTDHEELCGTSYGSFCLNGGICYMIPTIPSPFCRCIENYTGARCEEVLLPSIKSQTKGDLFAVLLASLLLLGVLLIGTFYFLCRKATIARTGSSECGAHLVETTSSNGCNRLCYSSKEKSSDMVCLSFSPDDTKRMAGY
ncbi:pro-neuregulin-4, membrane-bound isoform [Phasianus colchicus]|uniref:pro-neuregulin-4, membrane-bound isoform n=1 Tax=Phasianus colchicus TaxID=9054 RepID=UPI00129D29D5|nr:pro-neuregulin-4, membrane-bound isoform [Phasianus colchicus]XP_031472223.1 pro-neuregulin-4, membrane-bound isoform [Phasianus colchicus]